MLYEFIIEVRKEPDYKGDLIDDGIGAFVQIWTLTKTIDEALDLVREYVKADGAKLATIEKIELIDEPVEILEEKEETKDIPWEMEGLLKVVLIHEYLYDESLTVEDSAEA